MPYVITTHKTGEHADADAVNRTHGHPPRNRGVAVATLGEAREAADRPVSAAFGGVAMDTPQGRTYFRAARELPEPGGTIGPLPDGTLIEVEQVDWPTLVKRAGLYTGTRTRLPADKDRIIAAFNAAQ